MKIGLLQLKPVKMLAKTKFALLFYFLKLYNFCFYEFFVKFFCFELQHSWISKIKFRTKNIDFSSSILEYF